MKRSAAWMAAAVFALMGCTASVAEQRGADPAPVPVQDKATSEYAACFKNTAFDIDFDRPWRKPGPPGISAKTVFSLRLSLNQTCPMKLDPEKLTARIGPLTYRFAVENDNRFFSTKNLIVADRDLETGPVPIEIEYRSPHGAVSIPTGKTVFVDTKKPKAPVLSIVECGPKLFKLRWTASDEDGVKYVVKKFDHGVWVKLPPGELTSLKTTIEKKHKGWVRVEVMDRAGNNSISNETDLICDEALKITSMKIMSSDNDKSVTGESILTSQDGYAVEVMVNKTGSRLMLVNVDAKGFGYRLYPTGCKTGNNFDDRLLQAVPKRYPVKRNNSRPYLGLDYVNGIEDIYAIVCTEDYKLVKSKIWCWVQNEICTYWKDPVGSECAVYKQGNAIAKGTRELPGTEVTGEKRRTERFEEQLDELVKSSGGTVIWRKCYFYHRG